MKTPKKKAAKVEPRKGSATTPVDEQNNKVLETVEAMLAEAGIEVVDDERLTEDLVKKVAGRVAKRLLKEFG